MTLELGKLGRHRWVVSRQFLYRHVLRLVIRKTKVPIGPEQGLFGLLQVVNRLVDLLYRRLEALVGEIVVLCERGFECIELGFEGRDIDVLRFYEC